MKRTILFGLFAVLLLAVSAAISLPANEVSAQVDDTRSTYVYQLKHATAAEASQVLRDLFPAATTKVVSDLKTNSLIIIADRATLTAINDLLKTLDSPSAKTPSRVITQVIPLRFRLASALEQIVRMQLSNSGQFAVNLRTNSLVISDDSERIQAVMAVIRSLDVDPRSVRLECWLLGSDGGAPVEGHSDLAAVAAELKRIGLQDYGVFSHAAVSSLDGHEFQLSQSFSKRQLRQLELGGDIRLSKNSEQAVLNIRAALQMSIDGGEAETSISLTTTVKALLGDLVILGLAPTGNDDSKPIVMVVRIGE